MLRELQENTNKLHNNRSRIMQEQNLKFNREKTQKESNRNSAVEKYNKQIKECNRELQQQT